MAITKATLHDLSRVVQNSLARGRIKTCLDALVDACNGTLPAGFLSADEEGRAAMATGYFNEATATSKFAANAITTGLLKAGIIAASTAGRALFAAGVFDEATVDSAFAAGAIDSDRIKSASITSTQLAAAAVAETNVTASILTGKHAAVGAAGNTVGILPELFVITVANGSTVLDALTLDATYGKIEVKDVYFIKGATTGSTTDAVQLCTDSGGTTAVSSSLALDGIAEGGVVRTTSLTNTSFAAGAHLYVKRTSTTANNGTLMVLAYRVA